MNYCEIQEMMRKNDCFIIFKTNRELRSEFKEWCDKENVSMTTALNAMLEAAVKQDFEVTHAVVKDREKHEMSKKRKYGKSGRTMKKG